MRTEQELFDLILRFAKAEEDIRAVLLVGSRANPTVPKDCYQDYDITCYVRNMKPFFDNLPRLEAFFGKPSVLQMPERMMNPMNDGHFTYLMIFEDGIRIDLSFYPAPYVENGEPAIVLMDKDGFFPEIPPPSDRIWHVTPPSQEMFSDCCNEFWWCLNNVAKGIARDELPYAMAMFNQYVRDMLNQMVDWKIGIDSDFSVSPGKLGKYYKRYLPEELYRQYAATYTDSSYEHFWQAVETACHLFQSLSDSVYTHLGFSYNHEEEQGMIRYLSSVKQQSLQKGYS